MKKKLIIIWPWYFKSKDWDRYEVDELLKEKNLSVEIHEMINIVAPNTQTKTNCKKSRLIKNYRTIDQWKKDLDRIIKKNKVFILNDIKSFNQNTYSIKKNLKKLQDESQIILIEYRGTDCPEEEQQGIKFLPKIIYQLLINPKLFYNYIRTKFYFFLDKKLKYSPNYLLLRNNQKHKNIPFSKKIFASSFDYSNQLINKYKKNKKKKFGILIDSPLPNNADTNVFSLIYTFNFNTWVKSLNLFLDRLEKIFDIKIYVVPHPKSDLTTLKKYYGKRKIINSSISSLAKDSFLFVSRTSTALSFPVIFKKPIFLVYSNDQLKYKNYKDKLQYVAFSEELNLSSINIDEHHDNSYLRSFLKFDKKSYENYKYKYLTSKNTIEPNSKILKKLIAKHF